MSDLNSFGFICDVRIESDHPVHTLINNRSCLALLSAEWVLYFHPEGSERITGSGHCRGNRPGPVWVRIDPAEAVKKRQSIYDCNIYDCNKDAVGNGCYRGADLYGVGDQL